jgi:putative ABC transport system permease protein
MQDFRYALRWFRKSPGFTTIAILTLALGIGANTAIFSVINAVLLRPLPYRDPARLMLLSERTPRFPILSASYLNFKDWRDQAHTFESVGAVRNLNMTLTGTGEAERLPAQMATSNIFDMLGIRPALGRPFTAQEDAPGGAPVVLISHSLWQRRFGSSPQVVGQPLTLDNKPYTIIGVLPPATQILQQAPDFIIPLEPWARTLPDDRSWHPGILPLARLAPGVTLEQARAEMTTIARRLEQQYPEADTGTTANVNLMQEQLVDNIRPALLMLFGAVGFVLLIACTNVANLLLARATARQREIAVRTALGASRWRIIRLLLTESVLLALAGAVVGLILAVAAMGPLLRLAGTSIPATADVRLDAGVLAFTTVLAIFSGILFGLAPAIHMGTLDIRAALNETDRGVAGRRALRMRGALVVTEVAVAMILLVGAGLLLRSFDRLSNVTPGFAVDHLLIADLPVSPNAHPQPAERMAFFDTVLQRISALPGVDSAGATSFLPVSGAGSIIHFNIQDRPPKSPSEFVMANYRVVSPSYLKLLQVPLLQGRWMTDADNRENAPVVVVINQSMANTYFPNESPLGKYLQLGTEPDKTVPWMQVIGVVGDVKQGLAAEAPTEMYVPYRAGNAILPVYSLSLVLRTKNEPLTLTNSLRGAIRDLDANQPLVKIRTMEDNISTSVAQPKFRTTLLAILAALALIIAAVGIYGVMAYSVTQRTREIGIRLALGSTPETVYRLILTNAIRLTLAGVAVGIIAAAALTRYVKSLLFQVPTIDPITMTMVGVLLVVVAVAASYVPARRATRVDPVNALRVE